MYIEIVNCFVLCFSPYIFYLDLLLPECLDFLLTVLTDRVAPRISIRNATCIINYEFPMNKPDFGRRLSFFFEAMKEKVLLFRNLRYCLHLHYFHY